jgi:predicted nucleic-acid-binding protein
MFAVDTNIVVRLLAQDEPAQSKRSEQLFRAQEIFIPDTVILETAWVLSEAYRFNRDQIITGLTKLFGLSNVHLRDSIVADLALEWYADGLDIADALHLAQSTQCQQMLTFDQRFVNRARQLSSHPVTLLT